MPWGACINYQPNNFKGENKMSKKDVYFNCYTEVKSISDIELFEGLAPFHKVYLKILIDRNKTLEENIKYIKTFKIFHPGLYRKIGTKACNLWIEKAVRCLYKKTKKEKLT